MPFFHHFFVKTSPFNISKRTQGSVSVESQRVMSNGVVRERHFGSQNLQSKGHMARSVRTSKARSAIQKAPSTPGSSGQRRSLEFVEGRGTGENALTPLERHRR